MLELEAVTPRTPFIRRIALERRHPPPTPMPVVAVINRKGGSGKSTLASHLAGYCARLGLRVMLGDVDRQQSSLAWLRRRAAQPLSNCPTIVGWAVGAQSVMRPPVGITHAVLDTPGGLHGFDLARVVMGADVILMPLCDSIFDRESAADCYAELMTLPRVASGRCQVALVGMRLDARTKGAQRLEAWAAQNGLPYIGSLRESQVYPRCAEEGMTLFDLPASKVAADLAQWQPILDWVNAAWDVAEKMEATAKAPAPFSAPSLAKQSKRRPLLRSPMSAPNVPPAEFRPPREVVRSARADRFGWRGLQVGCRVADAQGLGTGSIAQEAHHRQQVLRILGFQRLGADLRCADIAAAFAAVVVHLQVVHPLAANFQGVALKQHGLLRRRFARRGAQGGAVLRDDGGESEGSESGEHD